MLDLKQQLHRWQDAGLMDATTAERIIQFESGADKKGLRWPAILAVGFGTLMVCAGTLLLVAHHWDSISPANRFTIVLAMVAVFHVAAGILGSKVPMIGVALHTAGTIALGAGIYIAGQIFNLEEHWPGGIMLWALGAAIGWAVLRQWPQALLAAVLTPWWLAGEWAVATERYVDNWNIAAQGLLLLAIVYFSLPRAEGNQPLKTGLRWVGSLAILPLTIVVIESSGSSHWWHHELPLPTGMMAQGYAFAYLPVLGFAYLTQRKKSVWIFIFAAWVAILTLLSRGSEPFDDFRVYLWLGLGSTALCWWGVRANRKLFINYGTAGFALTVIGFYFSSVMDKMGRAIGLISLGLIFLLGGWVLNRLRTDLIARAAAGSGGAK